MNKLEAPTLVTDIPRLPARDPATHKGQVGRVVIVAGSRGMSGAAVLCAQGALRGGAGLVRVCTPACVQSVVAASEPCLMSVALPDEEDGTVGECGAEVLLRALDWADVVAVGPGLGLTPAAAAVVRRLIGAVNKPMVLDADALNSLATVPKWWQGGGPAQRILTPHPGELRRLLPGAGISEMFSDDDASRARIASLYARVSEAVVLLKGRRTVVSDGARVAFNTTGNPGMASGGMGDVLTGLVAALLGQGLTPFDAARLGAHCHGAAADECSRRIGPVGYLARDVAEMLPGALGEHVSSREPFGFARGV